MNKNIVSNILWRFFEQFGVQIVSFVVSIILARLLDPSVYGLLALVNVFIAIVGIFATCGLGTSLIQKKNVDDLDYSSVFYFNFVICILLYVIIFVCAPYIASFYNNLELIPIIRVFSVIIIFSSIENVQMSFISKNLLFKKYFFSTLAGTFISAFVGIYMAYNGWGVWALVFYNVVNNFIKIIVLWFIVDWKPKLMFSFSRLKTLFDFGWKMFFSSLLDRIWGQLRQLIIGKKYTYQDLAFYNKGNNLPQYTAGSLMTAVDSVLFPTMSKMQHDVVSLKKLTRKAITVGSYVLWPMMIGFAVCSDNFIRLLLTEKWLPAVPYIHIFCITYAFYPIHTSNLDAIKALGRSDIFLILEIIKKVFGFVIIIVSMNYGVYAIALSTILSSVISQIINSYPNKKLLNYSYIEQLKDIFPSLLMSVCMGVTVYCVNFLGLHYIITLIIQVGLGIIVYILLSILAKNESFKYCLEIVSSYFHKK